MWRLAIFSHSEEKHMLRLLATIGAVYAAFKFGREVGRAEGRLFPLPPADYERRPRARGYDDLESPP